MKSWKVLAELIVVVVVEPLDGGLLDRAVHPFDLPVRPGMLHFGEPVLDAVVVADAVEDVLEDVPVLLAVGELDSVVGEHGVNGVRDGSHEVAHELGGGHLAGLLVQFRIGELGGPVDGYEEVELAFGRAHFGDVDVEIADRVALELLLAWLACRPRPRASGKCRDVAGSDAARSASGAGLSAGGHRGNHPAAAACAYERQR